MKGASCPSVRTSSWSLQFCISIRRRLDTGADLSRFKSLPSLFLHSINSFPFIFYTPSLPRSGPSNPFRCLGTAVSRQRSLEHIPTRKRILCFQPRRPMLRSDNSFKFNFRILTKITVEPSNGPDASTELIFPECCTN